MQHHVLEQYFTLHCKVYADADSEARKKWTRLLSIEAISNTKPQIIQCIEKISTMFLITLLSFCNYTLRLIYQIISYAVSGTSMYPNYPDTSILTYPKNNLPERNKEHETVVP